MPVISISDLDTDLVEIGPKTIPKGTIDVITICARLNTGLAYWGPPALYEEDHGRRGKKRHRAPGQHHQHKEGDKTGQNTKGRKDAKTGYNTARWYAYGF